MNSNNSKPFAYQIFNLMFLNIPLSMKSEQKERLTRALKLPQNSYCADCHSKDPHWASATLGEFICITCSGIHRSFGTHITFVKSCTLDKWTDEQVLLMEKIGNKRASEYWEANLPNHFKRPTPNNVEDLKRFINDKYVNKRWVNSQVYPPTVSNFDNQNVSSYQNDQNQIRYDVSNTNLIPNSPSQNTYQVTNFPKRKTHDDQNYFNTQNVERDDLYNQINFFQPNQNQTNFGHSNIRNDPFSKQLDNETPNSQSFYSFPEQNQYSIDDNNNSNSEKSPNHIFPRKKHIHLANEDDQTDTFQTTPIDSERRNNPFKSHFNRLDESNESRSAYEYPNSAFQQQTINTNNLSYQQGIPNGESHQYYSELQQNETNQNQLQPSLNAPQMFYHSQFPRAKQSNNTLPLASQYPQQHDFSINQNSQLHFSNQPQYSNQPQFSNQQQYSNQQQFGNQQQYSNQQPLTNQQQYTNQQQFTSQPHFGNQPQFSNQQQYSSQQQLANQQPNYSQPQLCCDEFLSIDSIPVQHTFNNKQPSFAPNEKDPRSIFNYQ